MDHQFDGDWKTLLQAQTDSLRAVFLGDPANPSTGIVELVDLAATGRDHDSHSRAKTGFLLLSVMTDVEATLERLDALGLGGTPRRVEVSGIAMAVVIDPDGVQVELVESRATENLERIAE